VKSFGQKYSKALNGKAKVAAPAKLRKPMAILKGPTEAAACDVLVFSGLQSRGAAGRKWSVYKYEVVDAAGSPLAADKIGKYTCATI
jgi:hypothetical protein